MSIFIGIVILLSLLEAIIYSDEMILVYSVAFIIITGLLYVLFRTYILGEDDYSEFIMPLSILVGIIFILQGISEHMKMEAWKRRFEEDGYKDVQKDIDIFLDKVIKTSNKDIK